MASSITLDDGKYTIVNELFEGGGFYALRYGEEWRSLAGDKLMYAAFCEIERLREKLETAESLLTDAHDILDDVHCYNTETYRSISKYFDGGDSDDEETEN